MAQDVSRRTLLRGGGAMVAGLSVLQAAGPERAVAGSSPSGDDVSVTDRRVDPGNIGPPKRLDQAA